MATPFVPGPAPIWLGGAGLQPFFLGWSERGVSFDLNPNWMPYYCDLGGAEPMDYSYQGQGGTISFTLVRWNPASLIIIEDYVGAFPGTSAGIDVAGEMGTLMSYEGLALSCWIGFPYTAKLAYSNNILGYHFYRVIIERESLPERGARPAKVNMTLRAVRQLVMTQATQNGLVAGSLGLYDNDMTAILGRFPD